jgi:DamX protein
MVETNPISADSDQTMPHVELRSKSAELALLSLERAQKLDLLNHLITNLQQSLVVCGPEGIGKTTLLERLIASKSDSWIVFSINATAQLSFELAQADLLQHIHQSDHAFVGQDIDQILTRAEKNNLKIVFIIDDAGLLVPGLINSLCQFASTYPVLRIIFALTADELHVKNSSDKVVDDCHFIEIPALTEQQCGEFLKNLSSKPGALVSTENLNSEMIGKLYRETHGIPGKIANTQKNQSTVSLTDNWQWISVAAAILIATAISFFLWNEEPDNREKLQQQIEQNSSKQQAEKIEENIEPHLPVIKDIEIKLPTEPDIVGVDIDPPFGEKSEHKAEAISEVTDVVKNKIKDVVDDRHKSEQQIISRSGNNDSKKDSINVPSKEARSAQENQVAEKAPNIDSITESQADTTSLKPSSDNKQIKTNPTTTAAIEKNVAPDTSLENPKPAVKQGQTETTEKTPAKGEKQKEKKIKEQKFDNKSQAGSKRLQGTKWVLDQKVNNYSLQLMAIAKQRKSALLKIINKHGQLQENLHYFDTVKNGEEKYILLYGSFSTPEEAKKAISKLPKEFGKPWLRSFKVLHKQISKP